MEDLHHYQHWSENVQSYVLVSHLQSSYVAKWIMVSRVKLFKLPLLLILNPKWRPLISIDHSCKRKPYIIQYRASIKISVTDLWFHELRVSPELKAIKNRLLVDIMQHRVSQIALWEGRSEFVRKRQNFFY